MDNPFIQQQSAPIQAPSVSSQDIENSHKAVDATMDGLIKLVSMPKGELTKKSVFNEASDMIAHGAFPTPEGKQHLITQLASLPETEEGIRKNLGQYLLAMSTLRNHMHSAFGPPQALGVQ